MRNFQDTFETRKRSFSNAFSICMTAPLRKVDRTTFFHFCSTKKKIKIQLHYHNRPPPDHNRPPPDHNRPPPDHNRPPPDHNRPPTEKSYVLFPMKQI